MDSTFLAARGKLGLEIVFWPRGRHSGTLGDPVCGKRDYPMNGPLSTPPTLTASPLRPNLRMHLNLALIRQAKGFLPYCLITYTEDSDGENIPKYTTGLRL